MSIVRDILSIFLSKKIAYELFPSIVFVSMFFYKDLTTAAIFLFLATIFVSLVSIRSSGKVPVLPLINITMVGFLLLVTLFFQDENFVKLRASLSYCLFALILLAGLKLKHGLLERILESEITMSAADWRVLTYIWSIIHLAFAGANELVWRTQSTTTWIIYDSASLPLLILLCIVCTYFFARDNSTE